MRTSSDYSELNIIISSQMDQCSTFSKNVTSGTIGYLPTHFFILIVILIWFAGKVNLTFGTYYF